MAGNCIVDDEVCREASRQEIIRRYYKSCDALVSGTGKENDVAKNRAASETGSCRFGRPPGSSCRSGNGIKNRRSCRSSGASIRSACLRKDLGFFLGASSALLLNALKELAGIDHKHHVISPEAIRPIQELKIKYLGSKNPRLHTDETLIALSVSAASNPEAGLALEQLPKLKGCQAHTSVMLSSVDIWQFRKLGIELTCDPNSKRKSQMMMTTNN